MKTRNKEVIVDLFCGAGGESQGIHWSAEKAGVDVEMYAVNHWERAIETHSQNFPSDEVLCRDIADINPSKIIPHGHVSLLWASPACTHFSVARGGKPMDEQSRVTPFTVLDWLDKLTVDRVIIENVPEFQSWGPLDADNRPNAELKGSTFDAFIAMMRSLGYYVDWRVLNAADFGAPTTRRRLFIQAVRKDCKKELLWPEQSHYPTSQEHELFQSGQQWVPAKDIIDWEHPKSPIASKPRPLADATMQKIVDGIKRFWTPDQCEPFIARFNSGRNRVHSIHEPLPTLDTSNRYALVEPIVMGFYGNATYTPISQPLPTLTTKERFALLEGYSVDGKQVQDVSLRMLTVDEIKRAQSFPSTYQFSGNRAEMVKQIGNAVCPKIAEALTHNAFTERRR
jgi:DNA (cytosine-5)-methyltransferase 1